VETNKLQGQDAAYPVTPYWKCNKKQLCVAHTHTRTRGAKGDKGGFKFVIEQQGAGRVLDFLLGTSTSITCSPLPFPFACFKLHRSQAGPPFSTPLCVNQCRMVWVGGRGWQTKYIAYTKLNSGERQRTAGGKDPFHTQSPLKHHPLRRKKQSSA